MTASQHPSQPITKTPGQGYVIERAIRAALKLPLHCGDINRVRREAREANSGSFKAAPPLRRRRMVPPRSRLSDSGSFKAAPPLRRVIYLSPFLRRCHSGSFKAAPPLRLLQRAPAGAELANSGSFKAAPPLRPARRSMYARPVPDSGSFKAAPPLRPLPATTTTRSPTVIRAALKLPLHCGHINRRVAFNADVIRAALKLPLHCGASLEVRRTTEVVGFGQL